MFNFDKAVTSRMKMGFVGDIFGGGGSSDNAPVEAANVQADAQKEALEYLKEQNALPTEYRDQALKSLMGTYTGDPTDNPMYKAQMANIGNMGQQATELSMAQNAATGGLRGGNQQQAFQDIGIQQNLAQNNALANAYGQQMSGLQGMAQLPTNANQIAQMTAGIGQTQAQGIMGAAQSQQSSNQAGMGNMMGLANLGMQAYGMFSDARLKDNLVKHSETSQEGISKYTWTWNDKAYDLGLSGNDYGYLAQEVEKVWPELVHVDKSGYKKIDVEQINERLQ